MRALSSSSNTVVRIEMITLFSYVRFVLLPLQAGGQEASGDSDKSKSEVNDEADGSEVR